MKKEQQFSNKFTAVFELLQGKSQKGGRLLISNSRPPLFFFRSKDGADTHLSMRETLGKSVFPNA